MFGFRKKKGGGGRRHDPDRGFTLLGQGYLREGIDALTEEGCGAFDPTEEYAFKYGAATSAFTLPGMGKLSARMFLDCANLLAQEPSRGAIDPTHETAMWVYHNLAQLAGSYRDYYGWVDILKQNFPNAPIFIDQYANVQADEKNGLPWARVQLALATGYAKNQNLQRPSTRYSCSAALKSMVLLRMDGAMLELEESELAALPGSYANDVLELASALVQMYPHADTRDNVRYVCEYAIGALEAFDTATMQKFGAQGYADKLRAAMDMEPQRLVAEQKEAATSPSAAAPPGGGTPVEREIENAHYLSALVWLQEEEKKPHDDPYDNLLSLYNHAQLCWTYLGQGAEALEVYEQAWNLFEHGNISPRHTNECIKLGTYMAENAMLLCPDADTFVKWRERLRKMSPRSAILSDIGEEFVREYENGRPWWDNLARVAGSYYDRSDPAQDKGRYGNGAATWQLVLKNRQKLRLPPHAWKVAALEYGILTLKLVATDARRLDGSPQFRPDEAAMPVLIALPFVREYVARHPGDEVETHVLPDMLNIERLAREARG